MSKEQITNNDISSKTTSEEETNRIIKLLQGNKNYFLSIGKVLLTFASIFVLLEIILVIAHTINPDLSHNLYPTPHELVVFAWQAFFPGKDSIQPSVAIDIGRSFLRVLIGFSIGVVSGILVGIIMGLNKWIYRLLNPIFSLMIAIPTLAWVPIVLTIFGLNSTTIIITVVLSCFFPIVYSTTNGIRSIDKKLIWAAQIMGANKIEIFFDVLLPGALVSIVAGIRLAIGYSWRAIVGAELLIPLTDLKGIGYYIGAGKVANQTAQIMIGVFLIALGGLLLDAALMKPLEQLTIKRWGMIQKTNN